MTDKRVEEATRLFIAEYPETEEALETLLAHQDKNGSWTFGDISLDSGQFGELVSQTFVEKTGDGDYRFVDTDSIESGLSSGASHSATQTTDTATFDLSLPTVNRPVLVAVAGALTLMATVRLLYYSAVFRDGYVVSPANDPYLYRYFQAQFLEQSGGLADVGMLTTVGEQTIKRPLTHTLNWWFAELLGGSAGAASLVAALQPVLFSLISAVVLYMLAVRLTADSRIAIASLIFLALTPVHTVYTSLGFLEHRSYQYLWLLLLVFALVWLAVDFRRRLQGEAANSGNHASDARTAALDHIRSSRTWGVVALLAFGVAASVHAWGGSPITFVPVGIYFALRAITDFQRGVPPTLANIPGLAGVGGGSVLAMFAHSLFGWQGLLAVVTPTLVTAGSIALLLLASAWQYLQLSPKILAALECAVAVAGFAGVAQLRPDLLTSIQERTGDLLGRGGIAETTSLFSPDQSIILGPLAQIGFGFYLGLVALLLVSWIASRRYSPGWLAVVCFGWSYLILAGFQVRFAAQLSIFLSLFAGIALVYLLGALELAQRPTIFDKESGVNRLSLSFPNRQRTIYIVVVVLFVLLLNLLFVPSLLGQVQHSSETLEAATAIETHSDSIQYDRSDYVLSQWDNNRMYNYFVSGNSSAYNYAQNFYDRLITRHNPDEQYRTIHEGRVGYVVLTDTETRKNTTHHTLFEELGAGTNSPAHYQLIHASSDIRVFALVEGAVINVTTDSGTTVTAKTNVSTAGRSFAYSRTVTATDNGIAKIRVAYPGEYKIGNTTITVTEQDIYKGLSVSSES
ncbi:hypothetical protein ACFQJ7_16900 [Halovenus rubra]|uniref:Uncharacterized protein n=2 Tax=Halovenus rubra TaxID=869890 RepID=A0ACC7DW77_9EURY|nr:hypothetical protein [Halovenus rubra]